MSVALAVRAAERAYAANLSDRSQVIAETLRLHAAGVTDGVIATLTGQSRRNVSRIVNGHVSAAPPLRCRYDDSTDRVQYLSHTADSVLSLAVRIRDDDPALTWHALGRLDRQALTEVAMIALAAIPVDCSKTALLGWVAEVGA